MTNGTTDDSTEEQTNNQPEDAGDARKNVVHVDGIKATFDDEIVSAQELILVAEENVQDGMRLEATRGATEDIVETFDPDEDVDLTEEHRSHFQVDVEPEDYI